MIASDETMWVQDESLAYRLIRSKKRRKSLALKIDKQGVLQVNVPYNTTIKTIENFILVKFSWIQNNITLRQSKPNIKALTYINGSIHMFKGVECCLELILAEQSKVEFIDQVIVVYHRKNSSIKNILDKWYKQQALKLFTHRTQLFINQFNLPEVKNVKVRNMRARWGSCSSKAEITYNIHLIKASPECIDYVIIHELCHLIHANHGAGFYRLQSQLNPYYKQQKKLLNDSGNKFIPTIN